MADNRLVLKEGFLKKRSRNAIPVARKWQRRYFKLYVNELVYCLSPTEPAVRRRVALGHDSEVHLTNDQGYALCFVVKASPSADDSSQFYLQAESEAEKAEWHSAIYNAARTLQNIAPPAAASPTRGAQPPPPPFPARMTRPESPKRVLLHLTIQSARNLKAADIGGKSDPYCVVSLVGMNGEVIRSEEIRTDYVTRNLNPEWNAKFTIGNAVDLQNVDAIHFELWDHDHLSRDTSLGFVRVPLSTFDMSPSSTGQSEVVDTWFRIEPPQKKSTSPRQAAAPEKELFKDHGELHLVMSLTGPNLVNFFQSVHRALGPRHRIVNEGIEHSDNRLEMTVLEAKDLISADFNNSSDPFCEFTLLDSYGKPIRGEAYTTSIKYKTRNPKWEKEHHIFGMLSTIDQAAKLKVRVMDWDKHSKDDPLGGVVIDLDQISGANAAVWYELQPEPGMAIRENLGAIQLKLALFGESRGERNRRLKIDKEVTAKTHEQSVEQLELENAQFDLHDAACKLDGARIACAVNDYTTRDPRFYGINGCIHELNTQIPKAHQETKSSEEGFQARAGLEGQAVLEVTVVEVTVAAEGQKTDWLAGSNPYAVIEVTPSVCVEECKRTSAPLSPTKSKRIEALNAAAADSRNAMLSKRVNAEVSTTRAKLVKNEVRSEKALSINPDSPALKVEVVSGHGLSGVDRGGYSDPYCVLTITDRETGKPVESEKKKTAVISRTLNPVWSHETFVFGQKHPLIESGMLLIHVKDHNNLGRSTPLGRVQIPLQDLCHASATSTSIASTSQEKRYALMPEPWMKKHAQNLGELCIRTEVIGDATVLAEMLQRMPKNSPEKLLSFLSFSSFTSDPYMQGSQLSQDMGSSMSLEALPEYEDEVTEVLERGKEIRTATVIGNKAKWRKEKFHLSLSYPGMFSDTTSDKVEHYTLHLRVHAARNLLGALDSAKRSGNAKALGEAGEYQFHYHRLSSSAATNAYFTVIPVLGNGELEHREKKQGLTVYGTRSPRWPEQNFVFGKIKDISMISYLSLHVYTRTLPGEVSAPLSQLLGQNTQEAHLKRHQLHKVSSSGEVDDDGFEILRYDQRVLAFRECLSGGRFFPARVQRYFPSPKDEYLVLFEGSVETIEDIRNIFSIDVKGTIKSLRADGSADVVLFEQEESCDKYVNAVAVSLLTPVQSFSPSIEKTLARRIKKGDADAARWKSLKHSLSALKMEVLSVSDLPKDVKRPGCIVTLVGNPSVSTKSRKMLTVHSDGMIVAKTSIPGFDWDAGNVYELPVCHNHTSKNVDDLHYFENKSIAFGDFHDDLAGDAKVSTTDSQQELLDATADILAHVSSVLIKVVDQGEDPKPSSKHRTLGYAKVDLAALQDGEQMLHLKLIPTEDIAYYKFVGSVNLHLSCVDAAKQHGITIAKSAQPGASDSEKSQAAVCGLTEWYSRRVASEVHSSSLTAATRALSRIERRQVLRSSLTPTENAQIDAFHAVLVIISKRIVSILQEIQLFEQFEVLPLAEMTKFRHTHTINADPNSEWIGRMINEMNVETRKDIVLHLEMELLDLAGSDLPRVYPAADLLRDEWVKLRTVRQQALQKDGGFFTQDRTSVLVLLHPNCFTGEGMISWILRAPAVLWKDQWTKYCHDSVKQATCRLRWEDPKLSQDPDSVQPPRTREQALIWLSGLSDAGYIENVSSISGAVTDVNRNYYVVEDKTDRFYRLREVERWIGKQSREKSLFPLDLVRELDCHQQPHATALTAAVTAGTPAASSPGAVTAETDAVHKQVFAKKLTDHVDGFLGTQNKISTMLSTSVIEPLVAKAKELLDDDLLWDWKYCLFLPSNLSLYVYESETSSFPLAVVDMSSAACHVAYNIAREAHGGWFEIASATIFVRDPATRKLVPMNEEQANAMLKTKKDGSQVLEFKSVEAQRWVQALAHAGVRMNMHVGQKVIMKRLNERVVQQKCIEFETEYQLNDLEGSFQRLLNRVFQHHLDSSHREHDEKMREMRAKLRSEMKKVGEFNESVLAYFGKGRRLNPKPTNARSFTNGALYSGRIVRIRTPYADAKYHATILYDRNDESEVPPAMQELLHRYKVKDKASWLRLPKNLRDIFLLYDIEYRHSNEIIIEEGMLREHFRTADGDLDPIKVEECCTDSNVLFKPNHLEDCITRMAIKCSGRKPLGCLKIPIKTVSPHREIDAWYPLAPENEMVQKLQLGQIRVQLRLQQISQLVRSKHTPAILEELKDAAAKQQHILQPLVSNSVKFFKDAVYPRSRRNVAMPSGGGAVFTRERSFLKISILEARKLLPGDAFMQRNPFVKIILQHERNEKEEYTMMKADVKPKTLNPKWVNQEFTLGKTDSSALGDKKAVLLRVMDETTLGETPLGFVKVELLRDKAGFITGLMLVHADAQGSPTTRALHLNHQNKVEVDAMLMGSKQAKGNDPATDGRLGRLRFNIELIRNENFVETGELASPTKMAAKQLDTKFSVELKIRNAAVAGAAAAASPEKAVFDWKQFTCVFQPHGEGGQRILYDAHAEDLVLGNKHRLGDLLQQSRVATPSASSAADASELSTGSTGAVKLLGRTYDVSKVAYFDVQVACDAAGKVFYGKFGENDILKNPNATSFHDEVILLKDKDNKDLELRLTIDFDLVGIHRVERVKRVLAETFRLVGMPFDAKTMSHLGSSGASSNSQAHQSNNVQAFLWEVFKVSIFPGRNVSQELLAQVRRMSRSTKLHWRFTPQLLCYVFEHVFCSGEKDLLTYKDAAALDVVLNRWSQILSHVSEAKNQLIGHLHGRDTPHLVQTLFTNCDWTGFEFAPVQSGSTDNSKASLVAKEKPAGSGGGEHDKEREMLFRAGDRVHASVSLCKHAGIAVDVCLKSGQFVAGTIIRECGDDSYDVAFCTAAKVREESDEYFSDDDELPPLIPGQNVFVCPLASAENVGSDRDHGEHHTHSLVAGRVGKFVEQDSVGHAQRPFHVLYEDGKEPHDDWISRVCLDSLFSRVDGRKIHAQLAREDFVRVLTCSESPAANSSAPSGTAAASSAQEKAAPGGAIGASRPAKVAKNYGNARYKVEFLDGQQPATESRVNRDRIHPLTERVMYDGEVTHTYLAPSAIATSTTAPLVVQYDVLLRNGALVEGVCREQLRSKEETFASDRYILGSVFASKMEVQNSNETKPAVNSMATKLSDLWGNNQAAKVYLILPSPVASVQLRSGVTNKLLQARLQERIEDQPRFIDQCHGYIGGGDLSSFEKAKLAQLYAAGILQRHHNSHNSVNTPEEDTFEIDNCVCVLLAPQPQVEIRGSLSLSSATESLPLFKALVSLALKQPLVFSKLIQKIVRSTASFELPLNRKERVLAIDKVDICFSKKPAQNVELNSLLATCDGDVVMDDSKKTVTRGTVALKHVAIQVQFHLAVPHNNRGSIAEAMAVAFQDANQIAKHLGSCNSLTLADFGLHDSLAEAVDAGHGIWIMEPTGGNPNVVADAERKLVVEVTNAKADKGSKPSISLELAPLDDVRLSVKDLSSGVHEICLPAEKIEAEAKLRRALTPFHAAKVVRGPLFHGADHPKQQQMRKPLRDALRTRSDATVAPYYEIKFADAKKEKPPVVISQDDLRFDRLHLQVLQVSQMFVKKTAKRAENGNIYNSSSNNGIKAEVMLISRDFESQVASDQALKPPHGVVLTPSGEICIDMADKKYPESSSMELSRDRESSTWTQAKNVKEMVFGHPGFDLDRVSAVQIKLVDKSKKGSEALIGTTTIQMEDIVRSQSWSKDEFTRVETEALARTKAGEPGAAPSADTAPASQVFSVERQENGRSVVVGKITLSIERSNRMSIGDHVQARKFGPEGDSWNIDPYELLVTTLKHHENKLTRGLLAAGPSVSSGGRIKLTEPGEQEVQMQKILNVMMIAQAMEKIRSRQSQSKGENSSHPTASLSTGGLEIKHTHRLQSPRAMDQLKHALKQTKSIVEDTAADLGIINLAERAPWSADLVHEDKEAKGGEMVVVHANVATSTVRLRRTILKLFNMYRYRLIPTLQELYAHDAKGDDLDTAAGEKMLRIFEEEVEDLDEEDQVVYRRVYQRLRLRKICQVLHDIMGTTLRVRIMDQNPHDHDTVGMAQIPLLDLIDQEEHFNAYKLSKLNRGPFGNALQMETKADMGLLSESKQEPRRQGKVHLRLRLTYSESALLEQAIHVYRFLKAKYIMQHDTARRRINAAVVPAQRRRWMTIKGYLDELKAQSTSKLHWERTPILLSLVWDIFASHKKAITKSDGSDADQSEQLQGLAGKVDEYRAAVVDVHKRWANIQPLLDELLVIQAAAQIHAERTPTLLEKIEKEVEGLDIVLSTAWQQVTRKWEFLKSALEELVAMRLKNKIHLGKAPQLLNIVSQKCSKGLNDRYADAVSNVQFRWMAITQRDGPLCELRLMEKKGLHWRRTHELVLLLNEQCEGFADVDAKALDMVESRWKQVQEWLDDVLEMHHDHKIDCEATPFILKKMHLLEHKSAKADKIASKAGSTTFLQQGASSPSKRSLTAGLSSTGLRSGKPGDDRSRLGGSPPLSPTSSSISTTVLETGEVDAGRLEGLIEWYAIEEAKYELERIPRHRITTDHDRNNWLPYSRDGKDTRLLITQEEMALTAANVRAALEDRGVIPKFSSYIAAPGSLNKSSSNGGNASSSASLSSLPKDLLDEIDQLELAVENKHLENVRHQVLSNPERFAELYTVIESLGKTDLLWKISHVVNTNKELEVPTTFVRLLEEMKMRQIPTTEIENLVRTLTVVLQKEELLKFGIDVPATANFTTVLSLMHRHQVKDVSLPQQTAGIQLLLQERGMDRRGEPIFLRGMRIGTQSVISDDTAVNTAVKDNARPTSGTPGSLLNTGLGLIDTHVELLRKSLLFEALRKRNSLIKTFPGETKVLMEEDITQYAEVDMSGDYMTLIERFQQLLIHESYTKRLASYAALDRCMRALVRVSRDHIVTKEDIAIALHGLGNNQYRLPLEAFTREELAEAASCGKIRTPTEQMLSQCPHGKNAAAMAYYAAMSYAAMVYQEITNFSSRFDPTTSRFQDSLPFDEKSSIDGQMIPKDRSRLGLKAYITDWLLGSEETAMRIQRQLGAYHHQRLVWASAAFTLCNRWFQRGYGWCDDASKGVGVKVLLTKLLIFEAANKMHMVHTEALLREVDDKCTNLRAREKAAKETLETRYKHNVEKLETLVGHAEKCINNRKLHSEETPALLHAIEQVCVVPHGLNARHMEAYHVVTSHWIPHRARLDELVKMHKEGTFSIHRTPELLNAMEFHTEGIAGSSELDEESIYAMVNESGDIVGNQQELLEKKIDEIRRGQRKTPSSLHLDLQQDASSAPPSSVAGDTESTSQDWKSLSPSKRTVQPLAPRQKHTSWKVTSGDGGDIRSGSSSSKHSVMLDTKVTPTSGGGGPSSPRRKSSLGDELKELLRSPSKWLLASTEPAERIRPELFFPQAVSHDSSFNVSSSSSVSKE